jgi:hypothetical protein
MQLDRCEPLKTGKTGELAVSPTRRFDCTRFFFSFFFQLKVPKRRRFVFFIFFKKKNRRNKRNKREPNIETIMLPLI